MCFSQEIYIVNDSVASGPPGPLGLHGLDGLKGVKGDMGTRGMGIIDSFSLGDWILV